MRTGVRRVKVSATPSLSRNKHQRTGSNPICRCEALWIRPGRGCSVGWRPNDDRSGGTVAPIGAGGDAGCWVLGWMDAGRWVLCAGCWGGGEPGLLPSLLSADVSDEDPKYSTLNATSSSLTNVTQRAASRLMINGMEKGRWDEACASRLQGG